MRVGIVGATGVVGQEFLSLFTERHFPFSALTLFASKRSAGRRSPTAARRTRFAPYPKTAT